MLNYEKSSKIETVQTVLIFRQNQNIFNPYISSQMGWFDKKIISRYCPLKTPNLYDIWTAFLSQHHKPNSHFTLLQYNSKT